MHDRTDALDAVKPCKDSCHLRSLRATPMPHAFAPAALIAQTPWILAYTAAVLQAIRPLTCSATILECSEVDFGTAVSQAWTLLQALDAV